MALGRAAAQQILQPICRAKVDYAGKAKNNIAAGEKFATAQRFTGYRHGEARGLKIKKRRAGIAPF
jgi:hypothetical protein